MSSSARIATADQATTVLSSGHAFVLDQGDAIAPPKLSIPNHSAKSLRVPRFTPMMNAS